MAYVLMPSTAAAPGGVPSKRKSGDADNPVYLDDSDLDSGCDSSLVGTLPTTKRLKAEPSTATLLTPPPSAESSSRRGARRESDPPAPLGFPDIAYESDSESDTDSDITVAYVVEAMTNAHGEVDLNRLVKVLDGMSRNTHMEELREELQRKRNQLEEFKEYVEECEEEYVEAGVNHDHHLQVYESLKALGNASRYVLRAARNNLRIARLELEQERADFECVCEGQRAHFDLVAAASELKDIFTQLWDMYETVNTPGTSTAVADLGSLFTECAYGFQLRVAITAARDKAALAGVVLAGALEYLRLDIDQDEDRDV
ncbi:hypothetical protein LTR84_010153 [Exophiala bonariae]|uniref:Uncharacterized protein n=1 Tax=Exophiala bonariae TaxID=1690606 RepID=A0AAV9MU61_9EURO|nr:hypothetical protein LTR84_010153 [Exophiala bonariae]